MNMMTARPQHDAPFYRQHLIWRRTGPGRAVRYVCFEDMDTGRFYVQGADRHYLPVGQGLEVPDGLLHELESRVVEQFIDSDPAVRSPGGATLAEAIAAFEAVHA